MLYPRLLRDDFEKLPKALRLFHSAPGGGRASGTATIRHASGLLARLLGFPPSGENVPLQLEVVADENKEVWIRRFGKVVRRSVQRSSGDLLREEFGPVRLFFRIRADESGLRFSSLRARLWMIPLPLRVEAREEGGDSSWNFEVTVRGVGSYRGVVAPIT